eukprot:gene6240-12633_t
MIAIIKAAAVALALVGEIEGFMVPGGAVTRHTRQSQFSMEYIPDGISKEQWAKMKEAEAKANAGKDLGKVGITKFKSRSFEAWQKDGQRHLFPVDPKTAKEEKPYMQRAGGSWDGTDLGGSKGVGQGKSAQVTDLDKKYEKLEKDGLLTSNPWAKNMPWTNEAAAKMGKKEVKSKVETPVKGAKEVPKAEPEKKKGFFGW